MLLSINYKSIKLHSLLLLIKILESQVLLSKNYENFIKNVGQEPDQRPTIKKYWKIFSKMGLKISIKSTLIKVIKDSNTEIIENHKVLTFLE